MPAPRHRNIRHRDRGLRRISYATRAFAAGSVALVGAFSAIAAHSQTGSKSTVRIRTTGATAGTAPSNATTPTTTAGTLPPDTFPPTGNTTPPTAATPPPTSQQTTPQTSPYVAPVPQPTPQPPQIVSGSS